MLAMAQALNKRDTNEDKTDCFARSATQRHFATACGTHDAHAAQAALNRRAALRCFPPHLHALAELGERHARRLPPSPERELCNRFRPAVRDEVRREASPKAEPGAEAGAHVGVVRGGVPAVFS